MHNCDFSLVLVGDSSAYDISINDPWPATTAEGSDGFALLDGEMEYNVEVCCFEG